MDRYDAQLKAVEREMRDVLSKARAITDEAENAGEGLSDEKQAELDGHLKAIEVLKEKRGEVQNAIDTRKRVEDVGKSMVIDGEGKTSESEDGEVISASRKARSMGEAFVKSDGYKRLREQGITGSWSTGSVEIEGGLKALLSTTGAGADTAGGALITADTQPGILEKLFQRLTVADLMAAGQTSSNLVRYMRETIATSGAAGVAEGADKPESQLEFDAVDEPVKKIATFLPVTDEMIEDVPALQSYINARLALFVRMEEERELLNGAGGNELSGLVGRIPGNNKMLRKAGANMTDADHVFRAISKVRESFLEPDAIVIHPNDWEGIVLLKDGQQNYLGPGPFSAEAGRTLWGLQVLVTTAVAEAQPIIGAFGTAAQVFRKGGLSVEASNSHSDYFAKNKTAIRAEERLALAVYRPEAFATADLGATGTAT
jgi:HK97 family phage major capsid protein